MKFVKIFFLITLSAGLLIGSAGVGFAKSKVIKMRHHTHTPAGHIANKVIVGDYLKKLEKATNNKIKITNFPGAVLATKLSALEACSSGIATLSRLTNSTVPGKFPLMDLLSTPGIGITDHEMGAYVLTKLFNNHPDLVKKELPGVKFLFGYTMAQTVVGTSKVPIRRMEDLKGLKLRVGGKGPAMFYQKLGATPANIIMPDLFMSMEKGVIDGWNMAMNAVALLGLQEVTKYYTQTSFFAGPIVTVMNLRTWNSLSPDIQKQINSVNTIETAMEVGKIADGLAQKDREMAMNSNGEYITLAPEERARWQKVAESLWDKEVAILDSRGLPGRALLNEVLQLVQEYKNR